MRARVIGLGQRAAGDDGVGLAVVEAYARVAPGDVEVVTANDGIALLPLFATRAAVVIVDAVLAPSFGDVRVLDADAVAPAAAASLSSHGLGVRESLALARVLDPEGTTARVWVVAIPIPRPTHGAEGLGPEATEAVSSALSALTNLVGSFPDA